MHKTAMETGKFFFETYEGIKRIADIGSLDVNGSLRSIIPSSIKEYVGVDFAMGDGVDIVLDDPYKFPIEDETFDAVVTSSCFEHSEMFWLTFLECLRIVKSDGLLYINVPSSWMMYHRFPVDCWRFFPDAGKALETWAKYSGLNTMLLESFITVPENLTPTQAGNMSSNETAGCRTADFVAVFVKDEKYHENYSRRMVDQLIDKTKCFNAFRFPSNERFPDGNKPTVRAMQDVVIHQPNGSFFIR